MNKTLTTISVVLILIGLSLSILSLYMKQDIAIEEPRTYYCDEGLLVNSKINTYLILNGSHGERFIAMCKK